MNTVIYSLYINLPATEHYGSKKARLNVLISFCGFLLMTIFMLFTIGFKESNSEFALDSLTLKVNTIIKIIFDKKFIKLRSK